MNARARLLDLAKTRIGFLKPDSDTRFILEQLVAVLELDERRAKSQFTGRVLADGLVTIPKTVRQAMGVTVGDQVTLDLLGVGYREEEQAAAPGPA